MRGGMLTRPAPRRKVAGNAPRAARSRSGPALGQHARRGRRAGRPRRARCPRRRPASSKAISSSIQPRRRPARRSSRGSEPSAPGRPGRSARTRGSACPGKTLMPKFGQTKWNWLRGISPPARKESPFCAERRRTGSTSRPSAASRYASGETSTAAREARMRDGAVVALEEVLAGDLPVRLEPSNSRAEAELERVDVDDLGELGRHVAERVGERRRRRRPRSRTRTGPTSRARAGRGRQLARRRTQARGPSAAPRGARPSSSYVHAWYAHWSVSRRPAPSATTKPAVAADVQERAELAVPRARDDDGRQSERARRSTTRARRPAPCGPRTATSGGKCGRAHGGARPGRRTSVHGSVVCTLKL